MGRKCLFAHSVQDQGPFYWLQDDPWHYYKQGRAPVALRDPFPILRFLILTFPRILGGLPHPPIVLHRCQSHLCSPKMESKSTDVRTITSLPKGPSIHNEKLQDDQERQSGGTPPPSPPSGTPYSVFTKGQKLWISMSASFSAMFSTMSSYIYYPALVPVAHDLGVSVALVNLSVTTYLIVAAIAPAFMGDMADQSGRRPIFMLLFVLMIAANVGIALQTSYAALLVLRMLQSAGASGRATYLPRLKIATLTCLMLSTALIAVTYGVIADITEPKDRGGFVGILLVL